MTATDELRRMLDERGVKWEDASPVPSMKQWKTSFASFTGEEVALGCYEEPKWIMGTLVFHTPEQAIEATLGRGTCHNLWDVELTGRLRFQCSKCEAVSLEITPRYCPVCGRQVVDDASVE